MELIFREFIFEHNTEIGQKDHLLMDTELKDVDTLCWAVYPDIVADTHFMTLE
jgi:hypothetical protein